MVRRLSAIAALLLTLGAIVLTVVVAVEAFPAGISVLACLLLALAAAWWGLLRPGAARVVGFTVAVVAVIGAVVLAVLLVDLLANVLIVVGILLSLAAARRAFASRASLPDGQPLSRPVLFYNPKSGGGKAERFDVAGEARTRGVEAVELQRGDDLAEIVRKAVSQGADALGMAGGDGSQAVVASIAAEHGLPYVCIPAGTRNHFALDLGVDRDDVVGALDAFTKGRERIVDLAEVNDQVFVNNVSLGVYAEAVQQEGYRNAKLRTMAHTLPAVVGPGGTQLSLNWAGPDGRDHDSAAVVLVSNDAYRLGRAVGSGTRPRLDQGRLGIAVFGSSDREGHDRRLLEWTTRSFRIGSTGPVAAGIDGEAVQLQPPLTFRSRPGALRVRIAPQHPGASPSANMPATAWDAYRSLAHIAAFGSD